MDFINTTSFQYQLGKANTVKIFKYAALLCLAMLVVFTPGEASASGLNNRGFLNDGEGLTAGAATPSYIPPAAPVVPPAPVATPVVPVAPAPVAAPVPAYIADFQRIEEMTGWLTCGACGNTGATGALANYSMTRGITTPSEDGSSSQFSISGRNPYVNGYWHIPHPPITSQINALAYSFDIFIPAGNENAPQAIEFECQQILNGWIYNFAWQANYSGGTWRIFNYGTSAWEDTGIPLTKFTPNTWHHIVAVYHNDVQKHLVFHDGLFVDGVPHVVNRVHSAKYTGNFTPQFTNAFQLDTDSRPTAYSVYVDNMRVTVQ